MIAGIVAGQAKVKTGWDGKTLSLVHFDGPVGSASITDETGLLWTNPGGARLSNSAVAGFGRAMDFRYSVIPAGSDRKAVYVDIPARTFGPSDDFTVECFFTRVEMGSISRHIITLSGSDTWLFYWYHSTTRLALWQDGSRVLTGTTQLSTGTRYHIALVKRGVVHEIFLNGVSQGTVIRTAPLTITRILLGGSLNDYQQIIGGPIDEFRFSLEARYLANFTPPSAPFLLD